MSNVQQHASGLTRRAFVGGAMGTALALAACGAQGTQAHQGPSPLMRG